MKKFIYQKMYKLLLIITNKFNNRYLIKYKILIGSSLLVLTSNCQLANKKDKDLVEDPDDSMVLCYDMVSPEVVDSIPEDSVVITETCYVIMDPELTSEEESYDPDRVYHYTEDMPEFQGGMHLLIDYLKEQTKLNYPQKEKKDGVQGRVVVQIIVERDGSITEPKIVWSVNTALDAVALDIIRRMPKWNPGKVQGNAARVRYTIPVTFKLTPNDV